MKILVTAFEPFGGSARNSSLDTLNSLPQAVGCCTVEKLVLPVVFGECAEILCRRISELSPQAVVCLGQAEGRGIITPEHIAVNTAHAVTPDNAGRTYDLAEIIEGAPDAYKSTLPVRDILHRMKERSIPSGISFTAGTYVCNDLMFRTLHHCKAHGIPAGFIHLPLSYEIAAEEKKAGRVLTLPQDVLTDGIICALEVISNQTLI